MTAQASDGTARPGGWLWFGIGSPVGVRHPVAVTVRELIPGWSDIPAACPHCAMHGHVVAVLDHLLGAHELGLAAVAEWLETVDTDLFCLAVHYLASEAHRRGDDRPAAARGPGAATDTVATLTRQVSAATQSRAAPGRTVDGRQPRLPTGSTGRGGSRP